MVVERNLSVPSGHLPFQGRLLVRGVACLHLCCAMGFPGQVTLAAYAWPKRQGVPAAVYGQPPECHGAEPKETRVVSPWEGSDPIDGWEPSWGPGACLRYMEILAGSRAALPTLSECKMGRPSADGRNTL